MSWKQKGGMFIQNKMLKLLYEVKSPQKNIGFYLYEEKLLIYIVRNSFS